MTAPIRTDFEVQHMPGFPEVVCFYRMTAPASPLWSDRELLGYGPVAERHYATMKDVYAQDERTGVRTMLRVGVASAGGKDGAPILFVSDVRVRDTYKRENDMRRLDIAKRALTLLQSSRALDRKKGRRMARTIR